MENKEIPQKFLNKETGELNQETLLKSYKELEKKMSAIFNDIPKNEEDYETDFDNQDLKKEINRRLYEHKFSKQQAKLFYDMLSSNLQNIQNNAENILKTDGDIQKLTNYFGGDENWEKISEQLENYGKSQLSEELYESLTSSYEGVLLLHKMFLSHEPKLIESEETATEIMNEKHLRKMMEDPRYWKDNDKDYIQKIQSGFEKLYNK